jgi:hypothetical protein
MNNASCKREKVIVYGGMVRAKPFRTSKSTITPDLRTNRKIDQNWKETGGTHTMGCITEKKKT